MSNRIVKVVKSSVDQVLNLVDNTSEGTNRMSVNKEKQNSQVSNLSKSGEAANTASQLIKGDDFNLPMSIIGSSQPLSKEHTLRQNKTNTLDKRNQKNISKSADSTGGINNINEMLHKPKGIVELTTMTAVGSSDITKTKNEAKEESNVVPLLTNLDELGQYNVIASKEDGLARST